MGSVWFLLVFVLMPSGGSGYPQKTLHDVIEKSIAARRQQREATCGGEFVNDNGGHIQLETISENGTEFYKPDTECTWNIKVKEDHHVILNSLYFDLELSDNCEWDYVEIVDGHRSHKFCSWDPLLYISVSNKLTMNFKSDYSYEGKGFEFSVMPSIPNFKQKDSDKGKTCNNSIIAKSGDKDSIWNHEHEGKNCYYSIMVPPGHTVQLKLKMLNFASTCEEERVVVRDGVSTHGKTLWTICSGEVPEKEVKRANKVFIEYHNPLGNEGDRFQIEYSVVIDNFTPAPTVAPKPSPVGGNQSCSGIWSDIDEGFTGHILYTAPNYEDDIHCVLVVRTATHNHVVQVHFNRFEMEDSDKCEFDSLNIFSGERADSASLGGPYCASSLEGRTFLSSGNTMRLVFKTDQSWSFFGFQANFTFAHMDHLDKDCECRRNAICVVQGFEKMCITGSQCSVYRCENGGTCVNNGSVDRCYCTAGYTGKFCNEMAGSADRLKFTETPKSRTVKKGGESINLCHVEKPASGQPVVYSWFFNGNIIPDYQSRTKFGDKGQGLLEIGNFDEKFEGRYTCVARAGNATAEHTLTLTMVEECLLEIQGPSDSDYDTDDTAIMSCSAHGAKDIWWEKDNEKIITGPTGRFIKMQNNFLRIANAVTQDSGVYTCVAQDTKGCESRKRARLTILNRGHYEKYCGIALPDQVRGSRAEAKISLGDAALPNENPWHASLFKPSAQSRPFCGGSLISRKFVVTAAHCITDYKGTLDDFKKSVTVEFASLSCAPNADLRRGIINITIHPQFNKTTPFDSDIALLELSAPVEYSDQLRPVCVPDYATINRLMTGSTSSQGKVVGCGVVAEASVLQPEKLQEIFLPYVQRDACEEDLENASSSYELTENIFCAGRKKRRVGDVCKGDSGGGFMMEFHGKYQWTLAGIVSFGFKCDSSDHFSYFTNVGKFYDWINNIAKFTDEKVNIDFLTKG